MTHTPRGIVENFETQVSLPLSALARAGRTVTLKRGQAIQFDDATKGFVVEKGTLEVQSSRFVDGSPVGHRRNLFTLLAGQGAFGSDPTRSTGHGWLGIASTDATVREIPLGSQFGNALLQRDRAAHNMLGTWVRLVSKMIAAGRPGAPASLMRLPQERGEYEFGKKDSVAPEPDTYLWVHVESGLFQLFNDESLPLTAEDGVLLIGGDIWIQVASEVGEVEVHAWRGLRNVSIVTSGLDALHAMFARFLDRLQREEEAAEVARRQSSRALRELETEAAMQELSQVLNPEEQFPLRETPLLTAASVIGKLVGVAMQPPRASEDLNRLNDPIEAIARASKVRHRKIVLGPGWSKRDIGPVIAFIGEQRRPVALLPSGAGYQLVDPDKRVREPMTEAHLEDLHPDGYVIYRPLHHHLQSVRDLLRFSLHGKGADIAFIGMMALCSTVLGMIVPRVTASVVDTAIPAADAPFLVQLALILFASAIAGAAFTYAQTMAMVRTSIRTEDAAQSALWDRLLRASPKFFRIFASGELQHRVDAVSEISRELNTATMRPLFSGVMALLNWLLLWYYSWDLAEVALYVGLVVTVAVLLIGNVVRAISKKLYTVDGEYHGLVIQLIGGVSKIRVAGSEERAFNRWLRQYTGTLTLALQLQRWKDAMKLINSVLIPCATALLFWRAVKLTIDLEIDDPDRISIGDFVAFNAAFLLYLLGWTDLSTAVVQVMDSASKLDRIRPLLSEPPEVSDSASDPGRLKGLIALDNVSFRYADDGPLIIDRISLEIKPGQYVAFVGPSGSGKSTILRLLLGFERPFDGRVLYDGKDLAGLDALAVRRQIGTVLQEGRLNAASILDNISNNAKVTLGEVWDAVADAGMTEDIQNMPMGLHTMISEGGWNISGGQRQRLLIARAMVLRPSIFMFDEATSALDNKTQAVVSQALDRRKCTRIVIAHRLSTIRQADRILVLDRGKIVQDGTFAELNAREGMFRDLMARQMI